MASCRTEERRVFMVCGCCDVAVWDEGKGMKSGYLIGERELEARMSASADPNESARRTDIMEAPASGRESEVHSERSASL